MITTTDETGRLNNYPVEPAMYFATFPHPEQQRRYLLQGASAVFLLSMMILVAFLVS